MPFDWSTLSLLWLLCHCPWRGYGHSCRSWWENVCLLLSVSCCWWVAGRMCTSVCDLKAGRGQIRSAHCLGLSFRHLCALNRCYCGCAGCCFLFDELLVTLLVNDCCVCQRCCTSLRRQGSVSDITFAVVNQIWSSKFWQGGNCILHPSL